MQWGPAAWNLLHGMGARAGKGVEKLRKDEEREILWLIKNLESIIPCGECRKHIGIYKKENMLKSSLEVGEWLWKFHEAVNERLGKSKGPPFTQDLGKDIELRKAWQDFYNTMKKELMIGNCRANLFTQWQRHFQLWLSFL